MLTRKRLRAYATIVAATIWTIWLIDMSGGGNLDRLGKVKGTDFLHFYVMGSIAREGRWEQLFDVRAHQARAQAVVPGSLDTLYVPVESPQLALLFVPLAAHRYTVALALWLAIAVALYACACGLMWHDSPALRGSRSIVTASCAAFPGWYSEVLHGQTACLAIAAVALAFFAMRRGWRFAAGLALGTLVFKPHWVAAAGAVFLAAREWRVIAGIVLSAAAQLAATYLAVGGSVMRAYVDTLRAIPGIAGLLEPQPSDSLRGLADLLVPFERASLALYLLAAVITLLVSARVWRSGAAVDIRLSAALLATILICPHVNAYDLILLAPVAFALANWLVSAGNRSRALTIWLCIAVAAPLMGGLPALIRLQFSVTAMVAMLVLLWRQALGKATIGETQMLHGGIP